MTGTFATEELIIRLSTPFYIVLIGLEIILTHWKHRPAYQWRDTLNNAALMILNGGIDLLFRAGYVGILLWFFTHRLVEPSANPYVYWGLLFLAEDFAFYLLHYVDHHCRLFWAVHVTHHSSEHFNLSTGFRSSVFQPLYRFVYFIPLALVGFHPADIVIMYSATQIYGILVHTKHVGKLGWLEHILVTPAHHRVHHASNVEYLDKNMGMCLIIWDKLFGTFQEELPTIPPKYGLTTSLASEDITHTIFHEWKAIAQDFRSSGQWSTRLKYLLYPPGWSPDGSRKTSKELQAEQAIIPAPESTRLIESEKVLS
ncbi:sterol desaturase family protein [Rhabdobacter roseus]|uniref:Sterol desaturase/sphingolipid hydroxylase (Fatty acid hydroxylase superfamily) n=1 Tax=Rhabdobacter roseus TaxID=1655419 RepID=A0A840TQA8_9BACT|nr:sterol desaturase family protein [Rhabdobacter roseus]MBB5283423.1 sterol desaturase/sphingolipid hydroxylase (fatty acid hydroxylase superfamily) [Rhabdobacter roseus]